MKLAKELNPSVSVFQPFNIIIAAVIPDLHFYENQRSAGVIPNAMFGLAGNIDGVPGLQRLLFRFQRGDARSRHHKPVFTPLVMELKTQTPSRLDNDSFDLVAGRLGQNLKTSPRTIRNLSHTNLERFSPSTKSYP
jgi:hypothetical protein